MSAAVGSSANRWRARASRALAHSLRGRLVALFVLLALAMVAIFIVGMQSALSIGWRDAARPLVSDYVDRLAAEIGDPPRIERARALAERLPISVHISGPALNWRSNAEDFDSPVDAYEAQRYEEHWGNGAPRFFERKTTDGHRIRFGLNVRAWSERPRTIGWTTLAVLLVLTAAAYARVRRMLSPLDDIRRGALRFGAGDFDQPIAVRHAHRPDELGDLAGTINAMAADIHEMLEAKRALLLAISHELRSPLTRARLNAELLPESPEADSPRKALLRDLALMRDLVSDLLESERLASPHAVLQRDRVDMARLVGDVVHAMPGVPKVEQAVDMGLPEFVLDSARMRLLLRNLLDNALRHSAGAALPPKVTVTATGNVGLEIKVRDFGPGVPVDALSKLAQAFYRPETARTRDGGGVGLGLYLCSLVTKAHGGHMTLRNAEPGLEVTVRLPSHAP